jgi:type II secretory pathway predicted ATPase ExeA
MYLDHFGLRTDPFPLYPSLKFVFLSTPFEETMAHLAYGIENEEDIILISGPIGTGKTLAVQSLLANLSKRYRTVLVNVTQLDFSELLKMVLTDLGAPLSGPVDRADLLGALKEQVRQSQARGHKILIVVDEAQNLAPETLEGLRMLTNLGQPDGQAVQLVLVGQPDIERRIALPQLAQLRQRIRVHYRIETLDRREIEAYIAHRLKVAGVEKSLFKPRAIDLIHRASAGVPRLVNILCSRALLSAFVAGRHEIEVEHIDLDDLPPAVGLAGAASPVVVRPAANSVADLAPTFVPVAAPEPPPVTPAPPATPASPSIRPAAEPPVARPDASPAGGTNAAARPFEPMVAFRRRNQRSRLYFLVALLLLAIAAAMVFSLKPARIASGSRSEPVEARDAAVERARAGSPAARPDDGLPVLPKALPNVADPGEAPLAPAAKDSLPALSALTTTAGKPGGWAVHVHSFHDSDRPETDIARLRRAGYPSFYRAVQVEGVTWQRVYVGPYSSHDEARAVAAQVNAEGLSTYAQVVKIGNGDQ